MVIPISFSQDRMKTLPIADLSQIDKEIEDLADWEGVLLFSKGLLHEAPEKKGLVSSLRPFLKIPSSFSVEETKTFVEERLAEVQGQIQKLRRKSNAEPTTQLEREAAPSEKKEALWEQCETGVKKLIQFFINELQKHNESFPDIPKQEALQKLKEILGSISFSSLRYDKLHSKIHAIRDEIFSLLLDVTGDVEFSLTDFFTYLRENGLVDTESLNPFLDIIPILEIEKSIEVQEKDAAYQACIDLFILLKKFSAAVALALRIVDIKNRSEVLAYISRRLACDNKVEKAVIVAKEITDKKICERALKYVMILEFRRKGGFDSFVHSKIQKELNKIRRVSSESFCVSIRNSTGICRALTALVVIPVFIILSSVFKRMALIALRVGALKWHKKWTVLSTHLLFDAQQFCLPKIFSKSFIGEARNVHKLATEDIYLNADFFSPKGVCMGMSIQFLHLYLKSKAFFQENTSDQHIRAVTQRFQKGASRVAALLQANFDAALGSGVMDCTGMLKIQLQTEEAFGAALFAKALPGTYLMIGACHACAYIKIDESTSYFFDPNFGTFKICGEEDVQKLVRDFTRRYLKESDFMELQQVSLC